MKKIILITLVFLSFFSISFADEEKKIENNCVTTNSDWSSQSHCTKVVVTEKIPWANCSMIEWWNYECNIYKWTRWVVKILWNMINWFTFLTSIVAVLAITICWIMYSMWWLNDDLKNQAKTWIIRIIVWLIILFSSWYILQLIAPWVYK